MKKLTNLLKYLFIPAWRRDYKLNCLVRQGKSAIDAMRKFGIIEQEVSKVHNR